MTSRAGAHGASLTLAERQQERLDRGAVVSWRQGDATASLARDPGDGRVLWAVTWKRASAGVFDALRGTAVYSPDLRPIARQGKAASLTDALRAVQDAYAQGRPE